MKVALFLASLTLPSATMAADGAEEEIVVTASKQAQPLNRVPISVVAATQDDLDRQQIRSVQDWADRSRR